MDDATKSAAASDDVLRTPPVGTPLPTSHASGLAASARHIAQVVWVHAAVALALTVVLVPAAAFFAAGIWAVVTYVFTARALIALVQHYELTAAFAQLSTLDTAMRVVVVSAGYFAVLCSTTVLAAGILGRGRARTFVAVGLVLLIPSALLFSFGARLTADVLVARFDIAVPVLSAVFMYALFDALLVGTLTVDTRARNGRVRGRRLRRRRSAEDLAGRTTTVRETPMVRFGPSHPVAASPAQDALNEPAAAAQVASDPTPVVSMSEAPAQNGAGPEDADAQPLAGVGVQTPPST